MKFLHGWLLTFYFSTVLNPNFFSLVSQHNLKKIHNPSNKTIQPVSSARSLGVIFDSNLSFSDHISYISKSWFSHIRDLRRIRNTLDHKTACTIATSLIHSKLNYCNSLHLNINSQQLISLQLILIALLPVLSQKQNNFIVTFLDKSFLVMQRQQI